jgi:hypothetical protein
MKLAEMQQVVVTQQFLYFESVNAVGESQSGDAPHAPADGESLSVGCNFELKEDLVEIDGAYRMQYAYLYLYLLTMSSNSSSQSFVTSVVKMSRLGWHTVDVTR